jgi:hypothetical protein
MTTYLDFPIELINELGTNKKLTREVNYAHGCSNSGGHHLHFCTMYEGKRYKTSQELKDKASLLYAENVKEAIKNVGNKLVFVGMGRDYAPRYEDDVCNHRIRTEIINPQGRKFFIEVGTWGNELMRIDHVVDRDEENLYNAKLIETSEKINNMGGFNNVPQSHPIWDERKKYQSQPYYWYKKDDWFSLRTKYTKQNVLKLINSLFECNFTEMEVDYNHLTTDNYQSVSPKI